MDSEYGRALYLIVNITISFVIGLISYGFINHFYKNGPIYGVIIGFVTLAILTFIYEIKSKREDK